MANWFYYDGNGTKFGPVNGATLKALAQHGVLRPDTVVETETGQRGHAGAITGLEFGGTAAPPAPPAFSSMPAQSVSPPPLPPQAPPVAPAVVSGNVKTPAPEAADDSDDSEETPKPQGLSPEAAKKVWWILGGFAILWFIIACFMAPTQNDSKPKHKPGMDDNLAMDIAEKEVKNHLKFPLDASFNWDKNVTRESPTPPFTDRFWVVTGTVKAPNALGAKLTHEYKVILTADDTRYEVVKLTIDGQLVFVSPRLKSP